MHDQIYLYNFDHTETRLALAETSVKAAVRLQPDSGETHLAQASHFYWVISTTIGRERNSLRLNMYSLTIHASFGSSV
jgi:hypothetical protein